MRFAILPIFVIKLKPILQKTARSTSEEFKTFAFVLDIGASDLGKAYFSKSTLLKKTGQDTKVLGLFGHTLH